MIIFVCHRVSHHDIGRAMRDGCESVDALQARLKVATCCGTGRDCAREAFTAACTATATPTAPTPMAERQPAMVA